jgi:hypothetical protein
MKEDVQDKMRRAKTAILCRDPHESFLETIMRDREAFSGLRVLYASDCSGTPIQAHLEKSGIVSSAFCGVGVLAFSDEIERQMLSARAPIIFAVRAMLDTNLLSDMPKFLRGETITTRDRVASALQFLDGELQRNIDWTFASLENLREVSKPNNHWPFLKSAAARYFIDHGISNTDTAGLERYIPEAEDQWRHLLGSQESWHHVFRRDLCYAVLLFAILECWKGSTVSDAMSNLVDFCLDAFETVPLKELYFGWKAIQGMHSPVDRLSLFAEPALASPNKNSLDRISALAWDLFLFRWIETTMTEFKGNLFYVPAVTTLDVNLMSAIKACPLRALLIFDSEKTVTAVFDDEFAFQKCLDASISETARQRINDPVRKVNAGNISRFKLSYTINGLEKEVSKAVAAVSL